MKVSGRNNSGEKLLNFTLLLHRFSFFLSFAKLHILHLVENHLQAHSSPITWADRVAQKSIQPGWDIPGMKTESIWKKRDTVTKSFSSQTCWGGRNTKSLTNDIKSESRRGLGLLVQHRLCVDLFTVTHISSAPLSRLSLSSHHPLFSLSDCFFLLFSLCSFIKADHAVALIRYFLSESAACSIDYTVNTQKHE